MTAERRIQIGKFGRPHGVKGEVRLFTDDPTSETPGTAETLLVGPSATDTVPKRVERARRADRFWLVKLEGADSRDDAEQLTNQLCFVARSSLPALDEGWYSDDLVGLEVIVEGEPVGRVEYLFDNGAHLVLVFQGTRHGLGEVMIPFTEEFVGEVDLAGGTIEVYPFEEVE